MLNYVFPFKSATQKWVTAEVACVHKALMESEAVKNGQLVIEGYSGRCDQDGRIWVGVLVKKNQDTVDAFLAEHTSSYPFNDGDKAARYGEAFHVRPDYSTTAKAPLFFYIFGSDTIKHLQKPAPVQVLSVTLGQAEAAIREDRVDRPYGYVKPVKEEKSIMKRLATHPDRTSWNRALKCLVGPEYQLQNGVIGVVRT